MLLGKKKEVELVVMFCLIADLIVERVLKGGLRFIGGMERRRRRGRGMGYRGGEQNGLILEGKRI